MKNIRLFENFKINEDLDDSAMKGIINKNIDITYDKNLLNAFKTYCIDKLVFPLKFNPQKHKYDFVFMYYKKAGTRATFVEILVTCDALNNHLFIDVVTGVGAFEKHFPKADTTKIKNVVDKVAYLSNLMIKNFAEKSGINPDKALEQQEKFKEILIKDGFKQNTDI
jgi:hypothetical protein